MKLSEKILELRKSKGMSQEDLADKLYVSRQAISRWESNAALPDASNILRISKLFGVTTDYLLNDEYSSDDDLPKVKNAWNDRLEQIATCLLTVEFMSVFLRFICVALLQNIIFAFLSYIPFIATIGGFEYTYKKSPYQPTSNTKTFRRKFYKKTTWLGLYFPVRFVSSIISRFYPRPYNILIFEIVVVIIYIITATLVCFAIDKNNIKK